MQTDRRSGVDPLRPVVVSSVRVIAVLAGVAATMVQLWPIGSGFAVGADFVPLREAARALLSGRSVYGDPAFVYPPSAVIALLVTAAGPVMFAARVWAGLTIAGLCGAAALIARQAGPGWRVVTGGVSTFALVIGCAANDSVDLENLSLLLVPVAVAALIAMGRGRWRLGCAVLCASLLVKPLLLPMLLLPLLFGHRRELVRAAVPTAVTLLLSIVFVPGGGRFWPVFVYDLSGTNLHGVNVGQNLSIAGWLEAHETGHDAQTALRLVGAAIVIGVIAAALAGIRRRAVHPATVAQGGNLVMLGALLVGGICEIHYLVVVLACGLLQLVARPSPRAAAALLPGIAMLAVPASYREMIIGSSSPQSWYVTAELVLLFGTACASARREPPSSGVADRGAGVDNRSVSAAAIICLLTGQAVLVNFWVRVVQFYGDRPIPFLEWVPSYPARSMRVLLAGIVLTFAGLGLMNSELNPWQSGLIAGAVVALSAVPVYLHNLDLRQRRADAALSASD